MMPTCWLPCTVSRLTASARHMAGSRLAELKCARNFGARAVLVVATARRQGDVRFQAVQAFTANFYTAYHTLIMTSARPGCSDSSMSSSSEKIQHDGSLSTAFPSLHLKSLNGLRTLLCFWIMLFHFWCYIASFQSPQEHETVTYVSEQLLLALFAAASVITG